VTDRPDLALLFLARGVDGGRAEAEAFFASYRAHEAGAAHDLVVLAKGWENAPGLDDLHAWTRASGGTVMELPDDGFDFGAYFRAAEKLPHRTLCFLNTHSRIRAAHWLGHLRAALARPGIGAAGATGNWESTFTEHRLLWRGAGVLYRLRHLKRLIVSWRVFPPFPNPCLRSNALIVERALFTEFAAARRIPSSKREAGELESGRRGFSAFVRARGLELMVVGADGKSFPPAQWAASGTFRVPGQANLLVADNRTRDYESADAARQRALWEMSWQRGPPP
jgi:hypothetical protein